MTFHPRDILPIYNAVKAGAIVLSFTTGVPALDATTHTGVIVINTKDNGRYFSNGTVWAAI
jgi:hypothetical protein